ncbi:cell death activator CIDE-B [Acipenser ruthenus]|uniref:cell death activator CIDE-B n=1 Tax=Acipenser ruthenus TaxID=7906 RepID=UPI0027406F5B|nr:cell death activator CIDE-B [Acipenser ruthenus]
MDPTENSASKEYKIARLSPAALFKSVTSVGSELSRRVWAAPSPPQRPFRVCTHDRRVKKGVTAGTLQELIDKAMDALLLSSLVSVVLDSDGTEVDSDEFFQLLDDDSTFMMLQPGENWRGSGGRGVLSYSLNQKPRHAKDIARVTFDLYKLNPRDLFGSLNVKATFYGLYSMSLDFKCLGPKKVMRELLRLSSTLLFALGKILLSSASFIRHTIEGADHWQRPAREAECWE